MPTKRNTIRLSDMGSILAVILSIIAICVSIIEANTTRSAARVEAWPYVSAGQSYNSEGFAYMLKNKGIGPALIETITVSYADEPVTDLDKLIEDILGPDDAFSYDRYRTSVSTGSVLSPGEIMTLFAVDWDPASRRLSTAFAENLSVEVCFCSVYSECWTARLKQARPDKVRACGREDSYLPVN